MVFESIITDVLNKVLGSYIENLDTKQLKLGIWGGDVVLTNLHLKQSALKELELPVQTVYGRLSKLTLKIPWKNIYRASVEATVEGLYLLVEPNAQVDYNAEKEANKLFLIKQKYLENIEIARKRELEDKDKKVDATFVEKLTTQIIRNVQINIKNIHVRYEDKVTNPNSPFAMGVTLSSLYVQTTDDNWMPTIMADDKITKIFKIVELQGLAVYWNSKSTLYREFTPDELLEKLQNEIATKTSHPDKYTYILGPIHSAARMKLNPRPDHDNEPFTIPKVMTNWEMEKLSIGISKDQYRDIIGFADSMALMKCGEPYRKYRPNVPYKGHYKEWWHFAYNCILEFDVRRRFDNWNLNHMMNHRKMCKEYGNIYKTKLQSRKALPNVEERIKELETHLDVMNIVLIRQRVKFEMEKLGKKQQPPPARSWFSGWWQKPSTEEKTESSDDIVAQFQAVMTSDEKQRLYKAIDYQENVAPTLQPTSFVDMVFAFVLKKLQVKIYNEKRNVLLTQFLSVKCKLETRTSANALGVYVNINQMSVTGVVQDSYVPKLISCNTLEDGNLLDVFYEKNPQNSTHGHKVHCTIKPLKVVYDAVTINGIVDLFTIPESSTLQQLSTAATSTFDSVKLYSSAGLQHMIDQHTQIDVVIDLYAPYIIIPYGGIYTETENILAINLGHAKLTSVDKQKSTIEEKQRTMYSQRDIEQALFEESYDQFRLEFSDLQVMVVPGGENFLKIWKESTKTNFHILYPLSLNLEFYKCLIDKDPRLPKCKISGSLPSLSLNITDYQLILLLGLIKSIPIPQVERTMSVQILPEKSLSRPSSQTLLFFDFNDKEAQTTFDVQEESDEAVPQVQQYTSLEVYFVVNELSITAKHQEYSGSIAEEVAVLTLQSLETNMKLQTYVQEVYVKLKNLMFNKYHDNKHIPIISTPVSKNGDFLFEVTYVNVSKKSPEFATVHKSCESLLKINFEIIKIKLHQEVLQELVKYGTDLQIQLEEVLQPDTNKSHLSSRGSLVRRMSSFSEGLSRTSATVRKKSKAVLHGSYIQTILFKLDAKLHEFQVVIGCDDGDFSSLTVNNLMVQVMLKEAYTEVKAVLKDINVMDLTPKTKYFNILKALSDEVINFKLILHNKKVDTATGEDMQLSVSLGCVRVVFLNIFVNKILDFMNKFQRTRAAIVEASQAAATKAKQNVTSIYENAIQMSLNVDIKAPQVIVPERSDSLNALIFDLGHLTIENKFIELNIKSGNGQNAVIDDMELKLSDVQLSRIQLDSSLEIIHKLTILRPINLSLLVKRNLSCSWYKAIPNIQLIGHVETIEVLLGQADYTTIMATLVGNLAEVVVEMPDIESAKSLNLSPSPSNIQYIDRPVLEGPETLLEKGTGDIAKQVVGEEEIYIVVKFNFVMDKFTITLLSVDNTAKDYKQFTATRYNLAVFCLEGLSVKGRLLSDSTLHTSVLLVDCVLLDARPGKEETLNKMFSRAHQYMDNDDQSPVTYKSMIDVVFQKKQDNIYLDLKISRFNLILSMEFLSMLQIFLMSAFTDEKPSIQPSASKAVHMKSVAAKSAHAITRANSQTEETPSQNITINLKLEKPDIVLVEHLNSIDTNALILNCELLMKIRLSGDHQVISGVAKDIQIYACCYNPALRETTKHLVLSPFTVSIAGSTPEGKGLHVEVCLTEMRIKVSPATIELLNRAYVTMYGIQPDEKVEIETLGDLSNIWHPKIFQETQFWFFKTEMGEDAIELLTTPFAPTACAESKQNEMCIVTLPLLVITVEIGEGRSTLPVLILESRFEGNVQNWSSAMSIDATITLQMGYYNSEVAVWEPLIEPVGAIVESNTVHKPWELKMDVTMNSLEQEVITPQSDITVEDIITPPQPKTSVMFSSTNNLELTVSKTTLQVLTNLSGAFTEAVTGTTLKPPVQDSAPYKFINQSGLQVKIDCEKSNFNVYQNSNAKEVILDHGAEVPLQLTELDKENYTLNEILANLNINDKFLYIRVVQMNCEIKLNLVRSDTRYFSLNYRGDHKDTWGVITSTAFEEGTYKVILSSIIKIYNHLQASVDVYYMTPRGNELECIGSVEPDGVFNVPIKAVYTSTNELFFSVQNYSVSSKPFVWKDLHLNVNQTQMLQCLPMTSVGHSEPFVMKAISSIQQVYNENSIKRTMNSILCNVHIHSTVLFRNCLPYDILLAVQNVEEETLIKPGRTLTVTNATPGASYVVIRLPSYLEKEWSCVRDLAVTPPQFAVWTFDSYDSTSKVSLDLGVHSTDNEGPLLMTLYCPFWMINKSDLNIAYRSSDENLNILHHPANFKGPILFSFNAKNFFGKKKASIKIENGGEWSDKFSVDVAGSSGIITCKYEEKIYQFGVNIQLTYNGLTKQVTFTPYYVLINNAPFPVECQEHDRPADPWVRVKPSSCSALWPMGDFDDKLLRIRVAGTQQVSAPFYITDSHTTVLKLTNKYGGVHVDTQITEGAIYITFSKYDTGMAPALIINHTKNTLNIWEKDTVQLIKLDPSHMMYYTWSNPSGARVLCWEAGYKKEIEDDLRKDGCGDYQIAENNHVYWASFLDGMQRTLLFTCNETVAGNAESSQILEKINQEITISIFGVGLSLVNNNLRREVMYVGIASSGIIWETCKHGSNRYKQMGMRESAAMELSYTQYLVMKNTSDELFGRMVVDAKTEVNFNTNEMLRPNLRKIRRTFLTGLWVQITTNPYMLQVHAKVNRLQIDNQMYDCIFPVVLAPVTLQKSVAGTDVHKPFAELSIVQMLIKHSQIKQFKYCKLLIQEFHIKLELGFVTAISEVFQLTHDDLQKQKENFLLDADFVNQPLYKHVSQQSLQEQKSFYDLLHFSPLKIHVSFSLGGSPQEIAPNVVTVLLQSIGVTLTDMQDVIFRIAYFEREYTFLTQKQLVSEATSHYIGQAVKQLYALVLGLDVLGNPYGLVLGITKGVEDLFYEPFQGAIQGPGEFAEGLALGVRSLFGHTVGGAAGAVSRITGAMGKGIAALTFDKEYQRKRRDQVSKKATTVSEGFARSGKGLVMGVYDGLTGVVKKPISGAKEQGVGGFFKGLGKGAVGLVARPTAGVIDFASGSLDTVKRVTDLTSEEVHRLRASRYIHSDGLIRPYNEREAFGNKILLELEKGKYAPTDLYIFHFFIIPKKEILLLTDKRLLYVTHSDLFGFWQADWSYTWQELNMPPKVVPKGVMITSIEPKKKKMGNIFASADVGKTILISDPKLADTICNKITEVHKLHSS